MRPIALLALAEFLVLVLLAAAWLAQSSPALALAAGPPAAPMEPPTAPAGAATDPRRPEPRGEAPSHERRDAAASAQYRSDDPLGIVVSGTVRSTDGAPVADASVWFARGNDNRGGSSAANGAYAAVGLLPGEWQLNVRASGFAPHAAACTLDDRAFQQLDLELRPVYPLKVRIQTPDGKPLAAAMGPRSHLHEPYVVATREPLTGDLPITESSRVLNFGLAEWYATSGRTGDADQALREQGYAGELHLAEPPPLVGSLLLRHVLLQSQRIEPGQSELVFTLSVEDLAAAFGTVRLRLLDGVTGAPLTGTAVRLATAQGGGMANKPDADGRVVIEQALPGLGCLQASAKDRESLWLYVRVPPGGTVDLGDITLTAVAKIRGVVVDAAGKPVAGAQVQWTDLDRRTWPQPLVTRRSATCEADGTFELYGTGTHRHVVRAFDRDGGVGYAQVDARSGAPAPVEIRLTKATNVALRTNFDQTVGYTVSALDAARVPVAVIWFDPGYRLRSFLLPPGRYTLEIHDARDGLVRSQSLQVAGEPLTIDVP